MIGGDDFYSWFLGPRMIYTSGVVTDNTVEQSLETLQDNKLAIVCEKLDLKPSDRSVIHCCLVAGNGATHTACADFWTSVAAGVPSLRTLPRTTDVMPLV